MLDLEPIKARLAAVPAPPWMEFAESGDYWIQQRDAEGSPVDGGWICHSGPDDMSQEVADFLVAAPSDIQALIAEVERLRAAQPAPSPSLGDRSTCKSCGAPIEYIGPYWRHVGPVQPRHPAIPKGNAQNASQASQETPGTAEGTRVED